MPNFAQIRQAMRSRDPLAEHIHAVSKAPESKREDMDNAFHSDAHERFLRLMHASDRRYTRVTGGAEGEAARFIVKNGSTRIPPSARKKEIRSILKREHLRIGIEDMVPSILDKVKRFAGKGQSTSRLGTYPDPERARTRLMRRMDRYEKVRAKRAIRRRSNVGLMSV